MYELSADACRVLGSLLEKEVTVPATYPLTLNSLVSACNQTSSRNPILSLTDRDVAAALAELRELRLTRVVHASHGARTEKYRQVADEVLTLEPDARAVLTVLLLRGPQTPGELRSRSDRLHPFADVDEVVATLETLAGRPDPLVVRRDRAPGQREHSWAHRLGAAARSAPDAGATGDVGADAPAAAGPPPEPGPIGPLAVLLGTWRGAGRGFYPTIAPFAYTETIELLPVPRKPMLAYRSTTRSADDGRQLHGESGFLRLADDGTVELVVAQGAGLVEIAEGVLDDHELLLASTTVAGTATAKVVFATERRYRVEADELTYEIAMAAVGQPLLPHLEARLRRG